MQDEPQQEGANNYRFIKETEEARRFVGQLCCEEIIGVDTETIWRDGGMRVSLLQIAPRNGDVLIFDALAIGVEVLRPLIDAPNVQMAAHNARFDQSVLAAENLQPVGFIDTLQLARLALRLPSYNLAEVVRHLFGINLDKSLQKSNWRRRPLAPQQLAYAAADARLTLRVYDELKRQLREQNRWEDALRQATLQPQTEAGGQKRRRKREPLPPLAPDEKRILAELKKWRLEESYTSRVPAYMICPDKTLHQLAQEKPATVEALASVYGLGETKIARYGEKLLDALRKSCG